MTSLRFLSKITLIPSPSPDGEGSPLSLRQRARVRENLISEKINDQ